MKLRSLNFLKYCNRVSNIPEASKEPFTPLHQPDSFSYWLLYRLKSLKEELISCDAPVNENSTLTSCNINASVTIIQYWNKKKGHSANQMNPSSRWLAGFWFCTGSVTNIRCQWVWYFMWLTVTEGKIHINKSHIISYDLTVLIALWSKSLNHQNFNLFFIVNH